MARKVFFSFHYHPDNWRASQIRNMGAVEGNSPCSDNDWENVTKGGEPAIKKWIDGQLSGKTCAIVLIGSATAGRKWVNYEIEKAWNDEKGLLGIYIHNLKDASENQSLKGENPFATFSVNKGNTPLTSFVTAYDPPYSQSTSVYGHIKDNVGNWIEDAIKVRAEFKPKL